MYARRVQIHNYGPIDRLDISFPFEGTNPKPVLLVGENGSGKSVVLSHIVNGLMSAQGGAYPETPEVAVGKVYKIRSGSYIRFGREYYFSRADFENDLFFNEIFARQEKRRYPEVPEGIVNGDASEAWRQMASDKNTHLATNILDDNTRITEVFAKNCVLYFPPNRFEEPAWLNQENLNAKAQYLDIKHIQGYTDRKVINYSSLHDNQNWLFEAIYDRNAFEMQTRGSYYTDTGQPATVLEGYSGDATSAYNTALSIVQTLTRTPNSRFGIGTRHNRVVSIELAVGQLVPNIFQLSSGETALLNLFLSILRDFDLTRQSFNSSADIRGIVVVDEIDLHLHATHQHEVLPALIQMFPKVQFIVTTHSPLFVLGMSRLLGEDGFAIYRLPEGHQISPEEFSEFGDSYEAFAETLRHSRDIQTAMEQARKPIAFAEGATDEKYIKRASELLGKEAMLEHIEILDGGGKGKLSNIWKHFGPPLREVMPQKMLLLFDCDTQRECANKGNLFQRTIPPQDDNPVKKGIENLFGNETLNKAIAANSSFIDIDSEHTKTVRGCTETIPETWTVNADEKTNLCNWLCENGTVEDFQGFEVVFELLEELTEDESRQAVVGTEIVN